MLLRIIIRHFIDDFRIGFERTIAVRKTSRNQKLIPFFSAELHCHMLSIRGRILANVDRNIKNRTSHHAHQFPHFIGRSLKMKPSYGSFGTTERMIILNKFQMNARCCELSLMVRFRKKTAMISKFLRKNDFDIRNICCQDTAAHLRSSSFDKPVLSKAEGLRMIVTNSIDHLELRLFSQRKWRWLSIFHTSLRQSRRQRNKLTDKNAFEKFFILHRFWNAMQLHCNSLHEREYFLFSSLALFNRKTFINFCLKTFFFHHLIEFRCRKITGTVNTRIKISPLTVGASDDKPSSRT